MIRKVEERGVARFFAFADSAQNDFSFSNMDSKHWSLMAEQPRSWNFGDYPIKMRFFRCTGGT